MGDATNITPREPDPDEGYPAPEVDHEGHDLAQIRRLLGMTMRERLREHEAVRRSCERLASRFRG